jgi:hypothetical protein
MTEEIQSDIGETQEFVTLMVGDQLCGIDVLKVRDVLRPQQITRVPLASGEVSGLLNLRGRIVTAINLRARLGLDAADAGSEGMSVVIERRGDGYVDTGALPGERGQRGGYHDGGDVFGFQADIAGIDPQPFQHGNQALLGESGIGQIIAGSG